MIQTVQRGNREKRDEENKRFTANNEITLNKYQDGNLDWLSNQYRKKNSQKNNVNGCPSWKQICRGIMQEETVQLIKN